MADSRAVTGGRDDLVVDASRCLRMRFSNSGCSHCADICPYGAVSLDGGLFIDQERCSGCLLCTAVCPAGALEQSNDFYACLAQLSRIPEPVLGCFRTKGHSNGSLGCLGGLSEEHLITLCHSLSGELTINLTACSDCPNNLMIPYLSQRLALLLEAGLFEGGCRIVLAESAQELNYSDESVGRRSFFKVLRNSLFKSATVMLSAANEQPGRRTDYAGKRVPARRDMLTRARQKFSQELEVRISKQFDSCISFNDTCTRCRGCVAICPTGALQAEQSDDTPTFDPRLCSGCGLCREFCLDGAVQISQLK